MRDRIKNILLSIAVAFFVAGCGASEPDPGSSGQGTLILSVGTGMATRAGIHYNPGEIPAESDHSLDDGDKMKNVRVWLVKDGIVSKFAKVDVAEDGEVIRSHAQ